MSPRMPFSIRVRRISSGSDARVPSERASRRAGSRAPCAPSARGEVAPTVARSRLDANASRTLPTARRHAVVRYSVLRRRIAGSRPGPVSARMSSCAGIRPARDARSRPVRERRASSPHRDSRALGAHGRDRALHLAASRDLARHASESSRPRAAETVRPPSLHVERSAACAHSSPRTELSRTPAIPTSGRRRRDRAGATYLVPATPATTGFRIDARRRRATASRPDLHRPDLPSTPPGDARAPRRRSARLSSRAPSDRLQRVVRARERSARCPTR